MKKLAKRSTKNLTGLSELIIANLLNQTNKPLKLNGNVTTWPVDLPLPQNYYVCVGETCCMSEVVTHPNGTSSVHVLCWKGGEITCDIYLDYK